MGTYAPSGHPMDPTVLWLCPNHVNPDVGLAKGKPLQLFWTRSNMGMTGQSPVIWLFDVSGSCRVLRRPLRMRHPAYITASHWQNHGSFWLHPLVTAPVGTALETNFFLVCPGWPHTASRDSTAGPAHSQLASWDSMQSVCRVSLWPGWAGSQPTVV